MVSQEVVQFEFWVLHELTRMHGLMRNHGTFVKDVSEEQDKSSKWIGINSLCFKVPSAYSRLAHA